MDRLETLDPQEIERVLKDLEPEERAQAEKILAELAAGKSDTLRVVERAVFERPIPVLDEFIFSKQYLNIPKHTLFPAIVDLLFLVDDPGVREAWICAGKGSGKSTFTSITMARAAHTLVNCYRDPSAHFGVLPGTMIAILNMSIGADQAKNVMFNKFNTLLNNAACFYRGGVVPPTDTEQKKAQVWRKVERHIELPKNVHALSGHSDYKAYFGYDVFCGVLDEVAWYRDKQDKNVSEEVYQGVSSSAITRFPNDYKILAISTPQAQDDIIYSKVIEARRNGKPMPLSRVVVGEIDGDAHAKGEVT